MTAPPMNGTIKVVVFDCDGVMFDTEQSNRIYYNTILNRFDRPDLTTEQFNFVHMSTVTEAIAYLFSDMKSLDEIYAFCRTMVYEPLIPHMIIEPHLKPLLKLIRERFKTAIATNRSNTMDAIMDHFELNTLFDLVVTSQDVKNPKPHPEQLIKIMDHFKTKPDEILYIGDSRTDEKAALNAGVRFVSYQNPSLEAQNHIASLKEVITLLDIN